MLKLSKTMFDTAFWQKRAHQALCFVVPNTMSDILKHTV